MNDAEYAKRMIRKCEERGEFSRLEDGSVYWFPSGSGAISATQLRIIADELDHRNKDWGAKLNELSEQAKQLPTWKRGVLEASSRAFNEQPREVIGDE